MKDLALKLLIHYIGRAIGYEKFELDESSEQKGK